MSRNKVILILVLLVALYLLLPNSGVPGTIKANMIAIAPYVLLFIIVWLLVTINLFKRALTKLNENICEENAINAAKLMNITFDVKRFIGAENLVNLYNRVNISTHITLGTKQLLYDSMKRKRLDVPLPATGKASVSRTAKGTANPNKKKKKKHK